MGTYLDYVATRHRPIRIGEVVRGGSWLSLVAETTPGMGSATCVRVQVRCREISQGDVQRLIVQAYAREDIGSEVLPRRGARPLGSVQRAVDARELRAGVEVNLVCLTKERDVVIVAWAGSGAADLEFDALRARPGVSEPIGSAVSGGGRDVVVVLRSAGDPTAEAA